VQLVTKVRKNMKNKLLLLFRKFLLRKPLIIETANDLLKDISQIEHFRHHSPFNFISKLKRTLPVSHCRMIDTA
jgi:hypothetical protein